MHEYLYYKYFKLKQKTRIYCVQSTLCPTTMHSQSILKMHKKCLSAITPTKIMTNHLIKYEGYRTNNFEGVTFTQ